MAMVSRVKKAGAIYPSIGCNVYRSRGPAICPNNKTISEKKVRESVLGFVRETIATPDLIDRFIKHFEQHYAKLEKTAVTADLNDKIHEVEGRVRNLVDALSKMGWSESVAEDDSPPACRRGLSAEPAGPPGRRPDPRPDAPREARRPPRAHPRRAGLRNHGRIRTPPPRRRGGGSFGM
jgi:hypothetical protein